MQTQLLGGQLTFSSFGPGQATQTAADEISKEIAEKEERIAEFRKAMLDDEEALSFVEEDRRDREQPESEDDLFEVEASLTDEDLTYTRYDSESEIKALEEEIGYLEEKLRR